VTSRAFVTLVTNADFAVGAGALLRSLALSGTTADRVCATHGGVLSPRRWQLSRPWRPSHIGGHLPTAPEFNERHAKDRIHGLNPFIQGHKSPLFHTPLDNFGQAPAVAASLRSAWVFLDADTLVTSNRDRSSTTPSLAPRANVYEVPVRLPSHEFGGVHGAASQATFERSSG
jgi:hypothetical protein